MKKHVYIIFIFVFLLMLKKAEAVEKYEGEWTLTYLKFQVTVESWGEHCGLKPSSYQSNKNIQVTITSTGKHLIFSKGNLRTDRCSSPNPRLQTMSASAMDGKWVRECQTDSTDPKYEKGKYSLIAKGLHRLEYTAESKFDWKLQDDHCIARSVETRIYTRAEPTTGSPETTQPPMPEDQDGSGCETAGPPKKLVVLPKRAELGPSERVCLKATATDDEGCSETVKPRWYVSQDGHQVQGLINQAGCFIAGDTAADSEGLYKITAAYKGKTDVVEVLVSFPDIGELLNARLQLSETPTPGAEESPIASGKPGEELKIPEAVPEITHENDGNFRKWIILGIIGIVLLLGAGLMILALRSRSLEQRSSRVGFTLWLKNVDKSDSPKPKKAAKNAQKPITEDERKKNKICPNCRMKFPEDAGFCPEDGTRLVLEGSEKPANRSSSELMMDGKICPKCHRGYDISAKYCPHDSEVLILYSEWRRIK